MQPLVVSYENVLLRNGFRGLSISSILSDFSSVLVSKYFEPSFKVIFAIYMILQSVMI
mgnify:CR=1 FL=1